VVVVSGAGSSFTQDPGGGGSTFYINAPLVTLRVVGGVRFEQKSGILFAVSGARSTVSVEGSPIKLTGGLLGQSYAASVTFAFAKVNVEVPLATTGTPLQLGTEDLVLEVTDSSFTAPIGLVTGFIRVEGLNPKLTITGTAFEGAGTQVQIGLGAQSKIRRCKFTNFNNTGVSVIGQADLGTRADPGMNEFTSVTPRQGYGLYDSRAPGQPQPIPCVGNTFNGETPTVSVTSSASQRVDVPGKYGIYSPGNTIEF
jgi:hypothetical protein